MRKMDPVNLTVYYPKSKAGRKELAERVSDVHAAAVNQRLKLLTCPAYQKQELLNAVIETVKSKNIHRPDEVVR